MIDPHTPGSRFPVSRTPLRYLVTCLDGKRVPLNSEERSAIPGNIPYWGANGVVDYINDWLFDEDLVLLGEDGAPFCEINKSVAFFVQGKVWVNNHTHALRATSRVSPRFLTYALNAVEYRQYINGSTRDKLTQDAMRSIRLFVPEKSYQMAVVGFLDRETTEADALVAKYERLIQLLEEKRVALITQAVTTGLDPNVPMKDSGVKWIGDIPSHWKIQRISRVFRTIGSGTTPSTAEAEWYGGDTPFVTTAELRENVVVESAKSVTTSALQQFSALRIYPAGTLLLAMYGATIGRSAVLGVPATVNQACCALGDSTLVSTDFAFKWFQAYRTEITALGVGGGQPNISQDLVRSLLIPIPPIAEQRAIMKHLDADLLHIERLRSHVNKAIELAKEHRSALITAAVTGEIDVDTYRSKQHALEILA